MNAGIKPIVCLTSGMSSFTEREKSKWTKLISLKDNNTSTDNSNQVFFGLKITYIIIDDQMKQILKVPFWGAGTYVVA